MLLILYFLYYHTYNSLCSSNRNGGWDFAITFSSVCYSVLTVDSVSYNIDALHLKVHKPTDDSRKCVSSLQSRLRYSLCPPKLIQRFMSCLAGTGNLMEIKS